MLIDSSINVTNIMQTINDFSSVKEFISSLNTNEYDDLVKYLAEYDYTIEECYDDAEYVYAWAEYM